MQAQTAEAPKPQSQRSKGQSQRRLTVKQQRFIKEYAKHGNGTAAARAAGYKGNDNTLGQVAWENLRKPMLSAAAQQEVARIDEQIDYGSTRVKQRLHQLSHGAERAEQYATAVRAEELIGKEAGMFVDRSIQLKGNLSADHLDALLQVARARQAQPLNLGDSRADTKR